MKYALDVAPLGDLADPRTLVRLAEAAESAGWDGFSTWDTLGLAMDTVSADPFVVLAAAAARTDRIALLASVIVLPRRRPQLVAQAAATLDRLSGGRLVLGIGAGGDRPDFTSFGEPWDSAERVARLAEAAPLVDALLRGETVTHEGPAYPMDHVALGPRPARSPRPPIWLGAFRPGGIRRAAAWDGWIAVSIGPDGESLGMSPSQLGERVEMLRAARREAGTGDAPFDVAVYGRAGLGGFGPADYSAVGATWWLESVTPVQGAARRSPRDGGGRPAPLIGSAAQAVRNPRFRPGHPSATPSRRRSRDRGGPPRPHEELEHGRHQAGRPGSGDRRQEGVAQQGRRGPRRQGRQRRRRDPQGPRQRGRRPAHAGDEMRKDDPTDAEPVKDW